MTNQAQEKFGIPATKRDRPGSARSRRRERRKEERRQQEGTTECTETRGQQQRRESISSVSSSSTLSTSSGHSCCTPEPKRPQHEKLIKAKKTKNTKQKKKLLGKNKKKSKPVMVEVEDISEDEKAKYVAIDCEMVGVGRYGERSALARVSIVNWEGDVLVDRHVKVSEEVTDYRTFVSGITQADLESDDAMDFDDCRDLVLKIIKDKVVVGHALKNDFDVLNIFNHPWYDIRDTARYEPFMKSDPVDEGFLVAKKLKNLARDKCGIQIQEDGKEHDSIEDAGAAMELYKKARRKWEKAIEWKVNKTQKIIERQQLQLVESQRTLNVVTTAQTVSVC